MGAISIRPGFADYSMIRKDGNRFSLRQTPSVCAEIMLYYTSQPSAQGDKRRIVSLRKRHERDFHKYDEWI
jgi:hypothetical protein